MGIISRITGIIICAVVFFGASLDASAQRTSNRTYFVDAIAGTTFAGSPSWSVEIGAGQYLVNGYWKAYVKASDYIHPLSADPHESYDHIAYHAGCGAMYRLFGTYNRAFSLYLGARVFLGFNQNYALRPLPSKYTKALPDEEFIFGAEPVLEAELYLSGRLAFLVSGCIPLTILSSVPNDWYNIGCTFGFRYNF